MGCRVILSMVPEPGQPPPLAGPAGPDLVELRLETVREPDLEALCAGGGVIATCRPDQYPGSSADRARLLEGALRAGARYVDVEWTSFAAGLGRGWPTDRLILSSHGSLDGAEQLIPALAEASPAVVKLAPPVTSIRALPRLRRLTAELSRRGVPACVFGTGRAGVPSRILTALWGGWASYGSAAAGRETGPGQLTADDLLGLYRLRDLHPETRPVGIVGEPLAHSLSPRVHNLAYRELGIDQVYVPFPTASAMEALDLMVGESLLGLSVTRPLKEAVHALVPDRGSWATRVGATNTLTRRAERVVADNTDAPAVKATLASLTAGPRVLVIGAGGAARAAVAAAVEAGRDVIVSSRRDGAARRLAADLGARSQPWERLGEARWDVLINATPVGQDEDRSPIPAATLPIGQAVVDNVYSPPATRLLQDARAAGLETRSGLGLLLRQAQLQIEGWTGERPPLGLLASALDVPPPPEDLRS